MRISVAVRRQARRDRDKASLLLEAALQRIGTTAIGDLDPVGTVADVSDDCDIKRLQELAGGDIWVEHETPIGPARTA
jgi:hypothetical protein